MIVKDHSIARRLDCRDSWHGSSSWTGEIWRAIIDSELMLLLESAFAEGAAIEIEHDFFRLFKINLNWI